MEVAPVDERDLDAGCLAQRERRLKAAEAAADDDDSMIRWPARKISQDMLLQAS